MNEWHSVTLGQISTQRKGINYKSADYGDQHSGHPFLTIKCFVKGGGYEPTGIKFYDGFSTKSDHLRAGDILFSVTDLTRAGDIVGSPLKVPDFGGDKPALASMDCMRIEPIVERCDKDFLFHRLMLQDVHRKMVAYSAGSTVLHLDTKKVPTIMIRVPVSAREQQKISAILTSIDTAIEKTEALIAKYQQLKAGLMHDLFTRGVTADGKLRPPREQAPKLYQETPLGWIPKEWDVATTGDLCTSIVPGRNKPALDGGEFPWITITDLSGTKITESRAGLSVSTTALQIATGRTVPAGSVIMSCVGSFGIVAIAGCELVINQQLHAFVANERICPEWLMHSLRLQGSFMERIATQTTIKYINKTGCESIPIAIPSIEEQQHIVRRVEGIERIGNFESQLALKLRLQKYGLMHDLLTGKVRVNPAAAAA